MIASNLPSSSRFRPAFAENRTAVHIYHWPARERLTYRYTREESGLLLRRYWTNRCQSCAIKQRCTPGTERRVARWEHEHVLEAVQKRLDEHPEKMRVRRETVELDNVFLHMG